MFDTKSTQRLGNDGFIWFIGVVEDIDDPLQLGRLRVRILGDHTQSTKNIPTDSLPWAYLMNGPLSSSMQGIGDSPTGIHCKGTWVKGFYWDGMDKQQPVITNSFGGIPESIPFNPKENEDNEDDEADEVGPACGFQDPDEIFPMGQHIFEQDTNRLARNAPDDHAFEIPEKLVPKQEKMIEEGLCPKKAEYGKEHYDTFDEAYVRKFAQGEDKKNKKDDTVLEGSPDEEEKELKVEEQEDKTCQYFLETNNHPFTVFKFIQRERMIPKAKVFHDRMHWEYWHEPDNPWAVKYPYNKVWEGYHEEGDTDASSPCNNDFASEAYGYDKSIENYDGSDKEGIYRKQKCGYGSWGLGEEWDSTPDATRYHRFTPAGNYMEIDHEGNEVRKIYGDSFEIDLKDKSILIKGDWNVTVEGDQNILIEGDRNVQVLGDLNTDVRGDIRTHTDGKLLTHAKEDNILTLDGDQTVRIAGSRTVTVCEDDYVESVTSEMRADEIVRKGGKSMIDEAFKKYELKAYDMEVSVCNLSQDIDTEETRIGEMSLDVDTWEERARVLKSDVSELTLTTTTQQQNVNKMTVNCLDRTDNILLHTENVLDYDGCVTEYFLEAVKYTLKYDEYLVEEGTEGGVCIEDLEIGIADIPEEPDVGMATYPETDGISKCLKKYKETIDKAKGACQTSLIDPRTLENVDRFDWEKYHASIESAKKSYEKCVEANEGKECGVCSPVEGVEEWNCEGCHDPDCPTGDKEYELKECDCECDGSKEEKFEDPWKECEQEDF